MCSILDTYTSQKKNDENDMRASNKTTTKSRRKDRKQSYVHRMVVIIQNDVNYCDF